MPACGNDFGLCVLDRAGASTERNAKPLEAALELEPGKLEQLGRLAKTDSFVEIIAEHPGLGQITLGASAGGARARARRSR